MNKYLNNKVINSILVVTPNYPFEGESVYPFVKNLCEEFARKGCSVIVLSPQSISSIYLHGKRRRPYIRREPVENNQIIIFQPLYLTAPFKYHNLNNVSLRLCLKFFFWRNRIKPDVCYCHFWSSGFAALPFTRKNNIPLFVASGESNINELFTTSFERRRLKDYVKGVICVSSKNMEESITLRLTSKYKCGVFPNAINSGLFYKRDKERCRKELGLPQDVFIVAFVGWFIERKGPMRVADAINSIENVNSLFIGRGDQNPECKGILFKGSVPHEKIPQYLSAADIFVLPTLHEGCCNAVIEAMACGLPIVSSNLPFNWDVLDETNSIMVDPNNVGEIADAIRMLRDNSDKRSLLGQGALQKAKSLTIDKRATAILDFMEDKINNYNDFVKD